MNKMDQLADNLSFGERLKNLLFYIVNTVEESSFARHEGLDGDNVEAQLMDLLLDPSQKPGQDIDQCVAFMGTKRTVIDSLLKRSLLVFLGNRKCRSPDLRGLIMMVKFQTLEDCPSVPSQKVERLECIRVRSVFNCQDRPISLNAEAEPQIIRS